MENFNKDFNNWNQKKKNIENKNINKPKVIFRDREIWWCSVGVNIGHEQDGKGEKFERPVLIFRKFNQYIFLGIPLTTKLKNLKLPFYIKLKGAKIESTAILSQVRLLSSKRLLRRIEKIQLNLFRDIKRQLKVVENI